MVTFENIDKARRLADNAHDIAEIQQIINDYNQGRKIDRQKAIEIINGLNKKDVVIACFNSPINSGWVYFQDATEEQIVENLNITLLYLSGKMTAEGLQGIIQGRKNNV